MFMPNSPRNNGITCASSSALVDQAVRAPEPLKQQATMQTTPFIACILSAYGLMPDPLIGISTNAVSFKQQAEADAHQ